MVTALNTEKAPRTAVAENSAPVMDTPAMVAAVDVSAIPETPVELLKQWDVSRKPLIHTVIAAALVGLWNAIAGPPMTDRQRLNRDIAEARGFTNGFVKLI